MELIVNGVKKTFEGVPNFNQVKITSGVSFIAGGRFPIESWKIWDSLSDLEAFIIYNGSDASAYVGMIVGVINDANNDNNGIYYIKNVGENALNEDGSCSVNSYKKIGDISYGSFELDDSDFDNYIEGAAKVSEVKKIIEDNEKTISISLNDLNDRLNKIEIVDNLTTSDSTKALSANQGKELNDKIPVKLYNSNGIEVTEFKADGSTYTLKQGTDTIISTFKLDEPITYGSFLLDDSDDDNYIEGAAKVSEVKKIIEDNEYTISESLNVLNNKIDNLNIPDVIEVVDNLTSIDSTKALSANQGKELKNLIGDLSSLQTTNKNSLVESINEIKNMLESLLGSE